MHRFLLFINKAAYVLLFLVIEVCALTYFARSSSYNHAKMVSAANKMTGGLHSTIAGVKQYFSLKEENTRLTEETARLRQQLALYQTAEYAADSLVDALRYSYSTARVINNSIIGSENFITLDKGTGDGITPDMAVVSGGAIVGYTLDCSRNFSVAISILNTKFRGSGKISGTDYSGPLFWDGVSYQEMVLSEVPKYATIELGDTILTTDFSSIFPPGLLIGTVKSFELINGTYYEIRVELAAKMGALNNVVLIKYEDLEEKRELETRVRGN